MFEGIPPQLVQIVSASLVTGSFVWGFSMYISGKLEKLYVKIDKTQENILDKLVYHERHDDARFDKIDNELWAIKVRNASKDGYISPAK